MTTFDFNNSSLTSFFFFQVKESSSKLGKYACKNRKKLSGYLVGRKSIAKLKKSPAASLKFLLKKNTRCSGVFHTIIPNSKPLTSSSSLPRYRFFLIQDISIETEWFLDDYFSESIVTSVSFSAKTC